MTPPAIRPALREAHAHLPMHGRELTQLNLAAIQSREEALDSIRAEASRLHLLDPHGNTWLLANAMRVESWSERRWITRDELDRVCPTRPAVVMSFDHHALVANTPALHVAGISEATCDPEGGIIERDAKGRLTGILLENAAWMVRKAVPMLTPQERRHAVTSSLEHLRALGFTHVDDLLSPPWLGPLLADLHDSDQLPLRVGLFPLMEDLDEMIQSSPSWMRPGAVTLEGGKVFADGTLNSRTAWMLDPYKRPAPGHPHGTQLVSEDILARDMQRCADADLGIAIHAIGDGAVHACLNAAQRTRRSPHASIRIEHCELIAPADIPRFARLQVIASVQPCHLLYDIEVLTRELDDRLDRVLPIASLIQSGLVPGHSIIFGSDVPIVRPDPQDSIIAATARTRTENGPAGGSWASPINPSEAISVETAWQCFHAPA